MKTQKICAVVLSVLFLLQLCGCRAPEGSGAEGAGEEESAAAENGADNAGAEESSQEESAVESTHAVVFEDDLGYTVTVENPQRVAALSGSYAHTWLLAGGMLAALTEDAYSEQRVEPSEEMVNLGALKSPDVELMVRQGIDFAILSSNIAGHVEIRDTLEKAGITTAYFSVETFPDYLKMLQVCTDITGREDLYEQNGLQVQKQIDAAVARKEGHPSPSVLFIRAYSTGAKAKGSDNMTGAMLQQLGCRNIADSEESLLENLSMEAIIREDPDYIFVTTMGIDEEAAIQALAEGIQSNPAWSELSAVKGGRYVVLPRTLFHYKPNNRWGESYEMLAEILYGEE